MVLGIHLKISSVRRFIYHKPQECNVRMSSSSTAPHWVSTDRTPPPGSASHQMVSLLRHWQNVHPAPHPPPCLLSDKERAWLSGPGCEVPQPWKVLRGSYATKSLILFRFPTLPSLVLETAVSLETLLLSVCLSLTLVTPSLRNSLVFSSPSQCPLDPPSPHLDLTQMRVIKGYFPEILRGVGPLSLTCLLLWKMSFKPISRFLYISSVGAQGEMVILEHYPIGKYLTIHKQRLGE